MKKKLVAMLLLMTLVFAACGSDEKESEVGSVEAPTDIVVSEEDTEEEKNAEETPEKEETTVPVTLYYPDDMAEHVMTKVVKLEELTAEHVWDALKAEGILEEACEINTFHEDGEKMELDVNDAFGKQLRSYGTAGELMMIQCTVNTFLDAFECEEIQITENGNVLESGHSVYDTYLTKME